jgi:hypothetical protein
MILQVRCHKTLKIKAIKKRGLELDGAIVKWPVTFLKHSRCMNKKYDKLTGKIIRIALDLVS